MSGTHIPRAALSEKPPWRKKAPVPPVPPHARRAPRSASPIGSSRVPCPAATGSVQPGGHSAAGGIGGSDRDLIGKWLHQIHFPQYTDLFVAAGYDLPTIARTTPEDLAAIGIRSPDHRMWLQRHVDALELPKPLPASVSGSIDEWLRLLGLQEYGQLLRAQGYHTVQDATKLTWEDLEDIGIVKLGHQKKILLAIKDCVAESKKTSGATRLAAPGRSSSAADPGRHGGSEFVRILVRSSSAQRWLAANSGGCSTFLWPSPTLTGGPGAGLEDRARQSQLLEQPDTRSRSRTRSRAKYVTPPTRGNASAQQPQQCRAHSWQRSSKRFGVVWDDPNALESIVTERLPGPDSVGGFPLQPVPALLPATGGHIPNVAPSSSPEMGAFATTGAVAAPEQAEPSLSTDAILEDIEKIIARLNTELDAFREEKGEE